MRSSSRPLPTRARPPANLPLTLPLQPPTLPLMSQELGHSAEIQGRTVEKSQQDVDAAVGMAGVAAEEAVEHSETARLLGSSVRSSPLNLHTYWNPRTWPPNRRGWRAVCW